MGLPNKCEIEGKVEQAKGKVKETVGEVTDNERLEHEGRVDQAKGNFREGASRLRREVGETIEDIGEKISR